MLEDFKDMLAMLLPVKHDEYPSTEGYTFYFWDGCSDVCLIIEGDYDQPLDVQIDDCVVPILYQVGGQQVPLRQALKWIEEIKGE